MENNKQITKLSKHLGTTSLIGKIKTAETGVKICDSSNIQIITLLKYLFALIGLNKKFHPEGLEVDVLVERLRDTLRNTSIDDLRLSFQLAVDKRTEVDLRLFGDTFSHKMVMEVYTAFKKYKHSMKAQLTEQPKVEAVSDDKKAEIIKEGALRCFESYKETKRISDIANVTYKYLYRKDLITISEEEKQRLGKLAEHRLLEDAKSRIESPSDKRDYKKFVDSIYGGQKSQLIVEFRKLVLANYFDELLLMDINLSELIN